MSARFRKLVYAKYLSPHHTKEIKGLQMRKVIILDSIIVFFALTIVFASMFSLVNASTIEHVLVRSGQQETLTINLQPKQTVTGSFNISGVGRDDMVDFWVRDPNGAIILNSGTVADGENFTFTASSDGEYVLNFQNNVEYNKNVDLEYSVSSPPILGFDPVVFSVIVIAIGIVLAIVGFAVYRNHAKRRTPQIPPP